MKVYHMYVCVSQQCFLIKGIASYEATETFASAEILTMQKNSQGYLEKDEN